MDKTGLVFILTAMFLFLAAIFVITEQRDHYKEYDYHIELKQNGLNVSIEIEDSQGEIYTIHPDSLEEFIIKDNI